MKKRNYLKGLRVLLAILFFVPILLFFVDFSGVLPDSVHRLLHLQLMPALLGGTVGLIVLFIVPRYVRQAYSRISSTVYFASVRKRRKEAVVLLTTSR